MEDGRLGGLGDATRLKISELRLDPMNPRLPKDVRGLSQDELAAYLAQHEDALQVAQSIVEHGYFPNEHLVVGPDENDLGSWVVLEGNRRLTALLGLTSDTAREFYKDRATWDELAAQAPITYNSLVPVVTVATRDEAVPIIGFRHISGIRKWDALAQARYVAYLAEDRQMALADIAKAMGITKVKVAGMYRNQAIVRQAQAAGIDTTAVEEKSSLLTVAMGYPPIREYIGTDVGSKIEVGKDPIPAQKVPELTEVLGWVFGTSQRKPIVSDSRQIKRLADVVAVQAGVRALRSGATLDAAAKELEQAEAQQANDPKVQATNQLRAAVRMLRTVPDLLDRMDATQRAPLAAQVRDLQHVLGTISWKVSG